MGGCSSRGGRAVGLVLALAAAALGGCAGGGGGPRGAPPASPSPSPSPSPSSSPTGGGGTPPASSSPPPSSAGPAATVTVTVDPILAEGASGNAVAALQALLNNRRAREGVALLAPDGRFGPSTRAAVERFQADHGLPVTGIVWQPTWDALRTPLTADVLGTIDPYGTPTTPDVYAGPTTTPDVAIHVLPPIEVRPGVLERPLLFQSQMTIDADGAGPAWRSDPNGQPSTSLSWPGGAALDPLVTPYFVLPIGFEAAHPEVRLGDLAAIVHRGRVTYAIYGDRGPRGKIGEASILAAGRLGIHANPSQGGVSGGVTYIVFPGSGAGRPQPAADVDVAGRDLFVKAGGRPPP